MTSGVSHAGVVVNIMVARRVWRTEGAQIRAVPCAVPCACRAVGFDGAEEYVGLSMLLKIRFEFSEDLHISPKQRNPFYTRSSHCKNRAIMSALALNPDEAACILRRLPFSDIAAFANACVSTRELVRIICPRLPKPVVAYAPHIMLAVANDGSVYRWGVEEAGVVLQRRRSFVEHCLGEFWETVSEPLLKRRGWEGGMLDMPNLAVSGGEVVAATCGRGHSIHTFKLCGRQWLPMSGERASSMANARLSRQQCQELGWDAATQRATVVVKDLDRGVELLMVTSFMGLLSVVNSLPCGAGSAITSIANGATSYAVVTHNSTCRVYSSTDTQAPVAFETNRIAHPTPAQRLAWVTEVEAHMRERSLWPPGMAANAYLALLGELAPGVEPVARESVPQITGVFGDTIMRVDEIGVLTESSPTTYTPVYAVYINDTPVAHFADEVTTTTLVSDSTALLTSGTAVVRLDRTPSGWVSRVVIRLKTAHIIFRASDNGDYAILVSLSVKGDLSVGDSCAIVHCGQPRS